MKTFSVTFVFLFLFVFFAFGCINQPGLQQNQTIQKNQTPQQNQSVQTNQTTQQNQTGIFMLPGFKRFDINQSGLCGDMVCAGSETQENCCADCGCSSSQKCWNNSCIAGSQFEELNKIGYSIAISKKGNFSSPMMTVAMPMISDNIVIWHQFFNGAPHIMVYSPASGKTVHLTNKSNQLSPYADGSKLVWLDQSVMNDQNSMNIYYYDAREGIEGFVTSRASGKTAPKIDSNHILWAEMVNNSKEIFLYDLASGKETQLTHGGSIPSTYYISGNYVVWSTRDCNVPQGKPCKTGYVLYDIGAGKLENFTEVKGLDTYCYDFQGTDLVYDEWESEVYTNGTQPVSQIVMFNVNSKTESQLTDSRSFKSCPRISGDLIIWSDSRNNGSLYSYNLGTHEESNLVNLTPGFYQYDVFGNTVVYVDVYSVSGVYIKSLGE
jgi:beta propeller repeat protein